jgi:tight adherence protein C
MTPDLLLPLTVLFIAVALAAGSATSLVLARTSPERRRLVASSGAAPGMTVLARLIALVRPPKTAGPQLSKRPLRTSPGRSRLQRRLEAAGWSNPEAAGYYAASELISPILFGLAPLALLGAEGWVLAIVSAVFGYLLPDVLVSHAVRKRQKAIQNGLPDALDLIVVCIEAGSSLDQAIVRASDELEIALPALAQELRMVTNEIRAGKARVDAFQDLARRTQVEDVKALVALLTQTDRFGTSIAQALRAHAATSRTKRRQRAEERASKVGVKLVFPLALCLVPALYVVCLGPVVVRILRALL